MIAEGCRHGRCALLQMSHERAVSLLCPCPGSAETVVSTSTAQMANNAVQCRTFFMLGDSFGARLYYTRIWKPSRSMYDVVVVHSKRKNTTPHATEQKEP